MGKTPTMRCEWDNRKLLGLIDWLEANDGVVVGMSIAEIIAELHWGQGPFQRAVEAAEAYGIIRVVRSGMPGFGLGRVPNQYHLVIGREQWIATGAAVVADWRRNGTEVPRLRKRKIEREARNTDMQSGALGSKTVYSTMSKPPPGGAWLEVRG